MKERPILFSGPMVRAILDGRKTQTRRVVRWPKWADSEKHWPHLALHLGIAEYHDGRPARRYTCPYGVPGDRLWVREGHARIDGTKQVVAYREGGEAGAWFDDPDRDGGRLWLHHGYVIAANNVSFDHGESYGLARYGGRWRPSIHMPRWASRILLEVVSVRVERVQDISEEDAEAEGIERLFSAEKCRTVAGIVGTKPEDHGWRNYLWHGDFGQFGMGNSRSDAWPHQFSNYKDAKGSFSSLWELINGKKPGRSWDSNPWVWCIEFRRIEP